MDDKVSAMLGSGKEEIDTGRLAGEGAVKDESDLAQMARRSSTCVGDSDLNVDAEVGGSYAGERWLAPRAGKEREAC
jgi:hypothetical protein